MRALTGVLFIGALFSLAGCQGDESDRQSLSIVEAGSPPIVSDID